MVPPSRFAVAPMMDRTDRHFRRLFRAISKHALLYTPMVPAHELLGPRAASHLAHAAIEQPLALQLGGCDPQVLASAARVGADAGMIEIDLNCGCPSPAAREATWGAALMDSPQRVADAVAAMKAAVEIPVTVKHRLGIAGRDDAERLHAFVDLLAHAGCDRFVVHARAAVLGGLTPAQNRSVPPLRHADVVALARARPQLAFVLNGGLLDADAVPRVLADAPQLHGVMVGRAAYDDPLAFAAIDRVLFDADATDATLPSVVAALAEQVAEHVAIGGRAHAITRHALGLVRARPGARRWRARIAELAHGGDAVAVLREAFA
ncbi:MAG TPA: tRNA dihydrouridine(20/20a) synthase DusA [Nannocystaceae bacterium]|nr:tRNA dihydrouridine(20/20a) synthase DusA [Nannocystaceae bacterium]